MSSSLKVALATVFGISRLVFLCYEGPYLWRWWFPDQPFGLTVKRWLRYLGQAFTVGLAYVQVRHSLNLLTSVDPGNFPTAPTALTALLAVPTWLLVIGFFGDLLFVVYFGRAFLAGIRQELGLTDTRGLSPGGYLLRAFGAMLVGFKVAPAV